MYVNYKDIPKEKIKYFKETFGFDLKDCWVDGYGFDIVIFENILEQKYGNFKLTHKTMKDFIIKGFGKKALKFILTI